MSDLPIRLNCTTCHEFTAFYRKTDTVVQCMRCEKNHKSPDSLYLIDPKQVPYERDEAGVLLELPP